MSAMHGSAKQAKQLCRAYLVYLPICSKHTSQWDLQTVRLVRQTLVVWRRACCHVTLCRARVCCACDYTMIITQAALLCLYQTSYNGQAKQLICT